MELCAAKFLGTDIELKLSVNGVTAGQAATWVELSGPKIQGLEAPLMDRSRRLTFDEGISSILQPFRLKENTEYDFALRIKCSEADLIEAMSEHAFAPFRMDSLIGVATLNTRDSWRSEGEWVFLTGRINFKNRAGRADLSVRLKSAELDLFVEVAPSKLEYEEHFHVIVDALAKKHVELLLRLDTGVETALEILEEEPSSPLQEMIHLRRLFESGTIEHAVRMIENNPTFRLNAEKQSEITALSADPDWSTFTTSPYESEWINSGTQSGLIDGWIPVTLPTVRKESTNDSKENRFIKHLLQVLGWRLHALSEMLSKSQTASHHALRRWQTTIQNILAQPFWLSVQPRGTMPNSMALVYRAGYRDIIRSFAELAMAVSLSKVQTLSDESGELKPVYDLYEAWCFFAFCDATSKVAGTDLTSQIQLVADPEGAMSVLGAIRGTPLKATFVRGGNAVTITVHYNRTFRRTNADAWQDSYSVKLRPDISLHIEAAEISHWLHFDAKYRLDFKQLEDAWKTELEEDAMAASFVEDDIHVMHTYRDAVLGTRGSFILYPGRETKARLFTRHGQAAYRAAEKLPSVGAFPLLPSPTGNALQELELFNFIQEAVERISSAGGYQEESAFV